MRKEYLGKIGEAHDAKHFNDELNYIWETKGYKNIKRFALILCVFRANMKIFFLNSLKEESFSIISFKYGVRDMHYLPECCL